MTLYSAIQSDLRALPRKWLVTGAAGFIGSHLVETLLQLDQTVVGLDNFSTGSPANLGAVRSAAAPERWARFAFIEGDIRSLEDCRRAVSGADLVLHQAALGSVPRSIRDPLSTHACNVDGFLNLLIAITEAGTGRLVYASSSSVYGDSPELPKREDRVGRPLSPYAATKAVNELYAEVFGRTHGLRAIGLRYFNVFGPRQDPLGPYAAVIPKWFEALLTDASAELNGDGTTSRDFCFVANAVQANLLAATTADAGALGRVFNVACGQRVSLRELFGLMRELSVPHRAAAAAQELAGRPERPGDVRHSLADIGLARKHLGYAPTHSLEQGLRVTANWYADSLRLKSRTTTAPSSP